MDQKIKKEWVKALRSGEYKQGRGRLKCGDEYCCLGVLGRVIKIDENDLCRGMLDVKEMCKIGLSAWDAGYLAQANDEGRSFAKIADYIEETL